MPDWRYRRGSPRTSGTTRRCRQGEE
jgi:hypothetical protein